jgi:hypothetical protein
MSLNAAFSMAVMEISTGVALLWNGTVIER